MRRRLEQLLNETFEYSMPQMLLSQDSIRLEVKEGCTAGAILTLSHPKERRIRAFISSSNPRMKAEPSDFYSAKATLHISVDTKGLRPGDRTEGVFVISSDLGQREVPCTVSIQQTAEETEKTDLRKLVSLAKQDFSAAADLFCSDAFKKGLQPDRPELLTLYENFSEPGSRMKGLEEFLIGTGRKEAVEISLDRDKIRLDDPEGAVLETLKLTCSGWGYLEMNLESDARFVRLEKKKLTTEDFAGNEYELGLIIDSNFLHAGINYARVRIRTSYQTLYCEIRADRSGENDHRQHRVRALMTRKAMRLYLDYRLGRIDTHKWTDRTEAVLASYYRAGGKDSWAKLLEIYVLHKERNNVRAQRLLETLEKDGEVLSDPSRYACWLYLSVLFQSDQFYVNEVRRRVRQLYLLNKKHWVIRWLQLYLLEDEFPTENSRLDLIMQQIELGCNSPILYMEGALILQKTPWLVHEWTLPVRMIISYAVRNNLMNEQLYLQIAGLILRKPDYDPVTFRILSCCYDDSRLKDILTALCTMAIAGGKKEERYFPVYQAAVSRELTINGLYEYYMETMGECRIERMPQIIRRYFVYNDALDWTKKALIYRNISDNSENIPQIYQSTEPAIRSFVTDQLRMGRVNRDLAVLYSRYINRKTLTEDQAGHLVQILFSFEVDCINPLMKRVIVADSRLQKDKAADLKDGKAQVQIFSENSRILLEDAEGKRYASTSLYMAEHLLDAPGLLSLCSRVVPDDPGIVLFTIFSGGSRGKINHKNLNCFLRAVNMGMLTDDYRRQLRSWLLDYYCEHPEEDSRFHFLRGIHFTDYIPFGKEKLVNLLTQEGLHEEAYKIVEEYGPEGVSLPLLVRICSQMVLSCEFEEKSFLAGLCASCFELGKYDENLLRYLLFYYEGTLSHMEQLWHSARQYELDTMDLERKILSMIVFTCGSSSGTEFIYLRYRASLGNRRLSQAYALLKSYRYLVKGEPTSELFFGDLLNDYRKGGNLPDTCALALTQYLSALPERNEEEDKAAFSLLSYFSRKGIRFAFYQRFPKEMTDKLDIDDRVFLECVADPTSTVKLFYRLRDQSEAESLIRAEEAAAVLSEAAAEDISGGEGPSESAGDTAADTAADPAAADKEAARGSSDTSELPASAAYSGSSNNASSVAHSVTSETTESAADPAAAENEIAGGSSETSDLSASVLTSASEESVVSSGSAAAGSKDGAIEDQDAKEDREEKKTEETGRNNKKAPVKWKEEIMKDVFQGIRVREFVLFGGEELECFTEEITELGEHRRSGKRILRARVLSDDRRETRYGKIYSMTCALEKGDREAFRREMEEYLETDYLTRELFTLM